MQHDEKVLEKTETKNYAESHNKKTSRQKKQIRDLFTSFSSRRKRDVKNPRESSIETKFIFYLNILKKIPFVILGDKIKENKGSYENLKIQLKQAVFRYHMRCISLMLFSIPCYVALQVPLWDCSWHIR
jgi:hypothetical protein